MRLKVGTFLILMVGLTATCLAQRRYPLDPLTKDEKETAVKIAREDPRVRELAGADAWLVYANFIAVKQDGVVPPAARMADVLFYRADTNLGIRALVDLSGRVMDVVTMPGHSVPLGATDLEIAANIARATPEVGRMLDADLQSFRVATGEVITREHTRGNLIEGLRTVGTAPDDPCTIHRCVQLLFSRDGNYLRMEDQITVDLTARRVLIRRGGRLQ
jgi:hypothetical protein